MKTEKQQTAVEWLESKMINIPTHLHEYYQKIIQQAKEMEREQIIESYRTGKVNSFEVLNAGAVNMTAEQYYNETFNKSIKDKG